MFLEYNFIYIKFIFYIFFNKTQVFPIYNRGNIYYNKGVIMFSRLKIILLMTTFLFILTACQKESPLPKIIDFIVKKEPKIQSNFYTEVRENNSSIPDIYGTYNLIEGLYTYGNQGAEKKEKIEFSTIVIEQLSKNEFGFYYVTKLKNSLVNSYFGGFTYKDGKFYQKVIDYPSTNTLLRDNITLVKSGNLLRLTVKGLDQKRTILWGRSRTETPEILQELEEEKRAYLSLYKKNLFP